MDCTPDGKYIITAADDHSLKVVDFEKKELVHAFENAHNCKTLIISSNSWHFLFSTYFLICVIIDWRVRCDYFR